MAQYDLVDFSQIKAQNQLIAAHNAHWPTVRIWILNSFHYYCRWTFSQTIDGSELGQWLPNGFFPEPLSGAVSALPSLWDNPDHREAIMRLVRSPTHGQCHRDVDMVIGFLKSSGLAEEVLNDLVRGNPALSQAEMELVRRRFQQVQANGCNNPAPICDLAAAQPGLQQQALGAPIYGLPAAQPRVQGTQQQASGGKWPAPNHGLAAAQNGAPYQVQQQGFALAPIDNGDNRLVRIVEQLVQQQAQTNQQQAQMSQQLAQLMELRDEFLGQRSTPLRFSARS